MSKADREKAAKGERHRNGQTVKMDPCPVEGCNHFVDPNSELKLCTECDRIGRVVKHGVIELLLELGILKRGPAPGKRQVPGGAVLLVPKPGLERAAIAKAAAEAGVDTEQLKREGRGQ